MENEMQLSNWPAMKEQASMLVKSGMLPISINTPEKAIAIAIASKELGIGMMEGFRSINVIQGKPTISPQLMLALAYRTGKLKEIKFDSTEERCIVTVTREDKSPHVEEFGVKEATALGLMLKDNYKKQRKTMMKWRALAANLRVTFPDVMVGCYTPEELGAEVKVTDTEDMEVVSTGELINTGVRVPKAYWDSRDQSVLGEGNVAQKTEKGWFIFSPKSDVDKFDQSLPQITKDEEVNTNTGEIFGKKEVSNVPPRSNAGL